MSNRTEILEKIPAISLLPQSVIGAIPLFQDPETPIPMLARAIECDPGLTSNILRLANSVFFGSPKSIGTVQEAIIQQGTGEIFRLVMSVVMASLGKQPVKGYDLPAGQLWEHSMSVALGVQRLSEAMNKEPSPLAYTAGQLHDVGKIVLGSYLEIDGTQIAELAAREKIPFEEAEYEVIGINHSEVGAALLENWNLPPSIVAATRWHHQPEKCQDEDSPIVDLVHVADSISMMIGAGLGCDGLQYHLAEKSVNNLNISKDITEQVMSEVMSDLVEMRSILGFAARSD